MKQRNEPCPDLNKGILSRGNSIESGSESGECLTFFNNSKVWN